MAEYEDLAASHWDDAPSLSTTPAVPARDLANLSIHNIDGDKSDAFEESRHSDHVTSNTKTTDHKTTVDDLVDHATADEPEPQPSQATDFDHDLLADSTVDRPAYQAAVSSPKRKPILKQVRRGKGKGKGKNLLASSVLVVDDDEDVSNPLLLNDATKVTDREAESTSPAAKRKSDLGGLHVKADIGESPVAGFKSKLDSDLHEFHDVPLEQGGAASAAGAGAEGAADGAEGADAEAAAQNQAPVAAHTFEISVGDPIKVGDITSSHTVYTVTTKTSHPNFKTDAGSVTRRYSDFRWLFHALENKHPGIVVPPPPDKQAVGRFNEDFVEARRAALETMLQKVARHHLLQDDPDLQLFLQSEQLNQDIKHSHSTPGGAGGAEEEAWIDEGSGSGLMSSLSSSFSFSKSFIETDPWFSDKRGYVDVLESHLKSMSRGLELVVHQRKDLAESMGDVAAVLSSLGTVEISKHLSNVLYQFSDAVERIKDICARQSQQDMVTMGSTLDEYLRVIGSVRSTFSQRSKHFQVIQNIESELTKRKANLDKLLRQGKTQQQRLNVLKDQVQEYEKKLVNAKVKFDDVSSTIKKEVDVRFENEKFDDFRNAIEIFLENAIEAQKEAIEVWETFYSRAFPS
ncbi:Sorting nexin-1 [Yarrowia sp. C11]|nr:Sorting nexin-1 [Yarrowia sp. E02]KAG5369681.1 Sorting nexin-1 [Yarrowia sp. C11]